MVNFKEDEQLKTLNHSCAHVMAQAIKHLYPQAKFWVGPVVAEGFYYDIDLGEDVIRDEDIEKITKEMKKVVKSGKKIIRREVSKEEALEMFADDPYKLDLIADLEEGNITVYDQGDFTDLCRGPHVDNVKLCKHFKLIRHSGAYWKGDSKNKMLQRIYGVCFPTAEELEAHLQLLEEAKERDHRKIGKDMNLFMVDDLVGRGLPMFLPKGYTIWQELENYIKEKERKLGYLHVMTHCVGTVNLYKTSGHWDHYKENMFPPMEMEGESFVLRPMNCPHHMMIYANKRHSYKNLPIRIGEIAHDFRYESSGTLKGIERGRHFCQNDAHLFVTPEQIKDEFTKVVELIFSTYKDFGITNYRCVLSLRDPENKEKYHDDDEMWNTAEDALRHVLNDIGIEYLYTQVQPKDKDRVQYDVDCCSQTYRHHPYPAKALGVDKGIHPQTNHDKESTQQIDGHVSAGVGVGGVTGAEEVKNRAAQSQEKHRHRRTEDQKQCKGTSHHTLRLFIVTPAPVDGAQRRAAGPTEIEIGRASCRERV